jgi:hypothetical protein
MLVAIAKRRNAARHMANDSKSIQLGNQVSQLSWLSIEHLRGFQILSTMFFPKYFAVEIYLSLPHKFITLARLSF